MTILYKLFRTFRTALVMYFLTAFVFMAVGGALAAPSAGSLFTVDDVKVDVEAENAIKAREKAFEQAQGQAFQTLIQRMLSEGDLAGYEPPSLSKISSLIQDFEVRDEKLSSKRYSAIYKFRFKDRQVRNLFDTSGAAYTDLPSQPILILPFLESERGVSLWSPGNQWLQAWVAQSGFDGLVPLIVPIGDLQDVRDVADGEALSYEKRKLDNMVRRYRASEAVIALARVLPGRERIEVQIYRTDRERPEYVHQVMQDITGGRFAEGYAAAASQVRRALQSDWKTKTVVAAMPKGEVFDARVQFGSLEEWSQVQEALRRVSGLDDFSVRALSPRDAYIELSYVGGFDRLKLALSQVNLFLSAPAYYGQSANYRLGGDAQRAIYELRFGGVSPYRDPYGRGVQGGSGLISSPGSYSAEF